MRKLPILHPPANAFFKKVDTRPVLHHIRAMKARLRNITITLEESVARWARLEAATQETSVSRFLANLLKEHMKHNEEYEAAKQRALARKSLPKSDGRYLSREEVHERARFR
jgi:hypothetical protein